MRGVWCVPFGDVGLWEDKYLEEVAWDLNGWSKLSHCLVCAGVMLISKHSFVINQSRVLFLSFMGYF